MLSQKEIQQAVKLYLRRKFTQYAILIDGEWGVGKTHLLTRTILPYIDDIRFFHVSLYGLNSIQDIENELYKCLSLSTSSWSKNDPEADNPAPDLLPGAKLGGVSFAVQYLVRNIQESFGDDCSLVLCFDDLERWSGRFDVCFSYINKLAEHENLKCILLGNSHGLSQAGLDYLARAREKTVRHIYRFENPVDDRVSIALNLIDYQSDANREYVFRLFEQNRTALTTFLRKIDEKNIRTLSEAIQLFEYVLTRHFTTFEKAGNLPFTYFLTLLSSLILFKKYLLKDKLRNQLIESSEHTSNGFHLLTKIGYFEKNAPSHITEESKVLLDAIFYRLDEIALSGVFSIIERGFYIEKDFVGNFDRWSEAHILEAYLDKYSFYQLEEAQALSLLDNVVELVIEKQAIKNPATLLLFAERLSDDISKGVLGNDSEDYLERLKALIDELYVSNAMEAMDLEFLKTHAHRYIKCESVFQFVLSRNREYFALRQKASHKGFWELIAQKPEEIPAIFSAMPERALIADLTKPEQVLDCIEGLNNQQLVTLSQELIDCKRASVSDQMRIDDISILQTVAERVHNNYETTAGVRAANMRELASIIASF